MAGIQPAYKCVVLTEYAKKGVGLQKFSSENSLCAPEWFPPAPATADALARGRCTIHRASTMEVGALDDTGLGRYGM